MHPKKNQIVTAQGNMKGKCGTFFSHEESIDWTDMQIESTRIAGDQPARRRVPANKPRVVTC